MAGLDYDLAVIGGGPAGSSAAIVAARTGVRVLLAERGHLPRHKVCGEFVSPEALGQLAGLLENTGFDGKYSQRRSAGGASEPSGSVHYPL